MTRRQLGIYSMIAAIFLLNLAGASLITVAGSDQEPFEKTFPGQCASPIVSVVYEDPKKPNPKVVEVHLEGDFSNCVGAQVLVTTYKNRHVHGYAVAEILDFQGKIQLSLKKNGGDFYQKFPNIIADRLVSNGPTSPSSDSIDPANIEVVFAWAWS